MKPREKAPGPALKVVPDDRLGAVVPALLPTSLIDADLSNVIVLAHHKRSDEAEAPAVELNDNQRPAPDTVAPQRRTPWTALIAGTLLLHLVVVLAFLRAPQPLPEAGLEAISVDLEIGNEQPVGIAATPSEPAEAPQPDSKQEPQVAQTEPDRPVEPEKPELKVEKPEPPALAAAEPEPQPERKPPEPDAMPAPDPREVPREEPKLEAAMTTPPEPQREAPKPEIAEQPKPQPQKPAPKKSAKKASPAQSAEAGGVGSGQSSAQRSYFSEVATHLSRHKRFPAEARAAGHRGIAMVSFTIDGAGTVGAVSLARSSGIASLDTESQAMVRRASPFPAPPEGRSLTFTVPVNFDLR